MPHTVQAGRRVCELDHRGVIAESSLHAEVSHPTAEPRRILLMTATIQPPAGARALKVRDPAVRLAEYDSALAFYRSLLNKGIDQIVFAENSEAELEPLRNRVVESGHEVGVEFLSFNGLDYPPHFGRGYGEFKLIDYAMTHWRFLLDARPQASIWKVTGRYIVRNLSQMVRTAPAHYDLYCDLRTFPQTWMDLRLFSFTRPTYERLLRGKYRDLSEADGQPAPEATMYRTVRAHLKDGQIVPRFSREPLVDGVRAYDGRRYDQGKNRVKRIVRGLSRRFAPAIWI